MKAALISRVSAASISIRPASMPFSPILRRSRRSGASWRTDASTPRGRRALQCASFAGFTRVADEQRADEPERDEHGYPGHDDRAECERGKRARIYLLESGRVQRHA